MRMTQSYQHDSNFTNRASRSSSTFFSSGTEPKDC